MSFSARNMRSATGMELCKGARPTAPVATWRRGNVVVQARYSYDEDTPSRRPSRPTRAWDDAPEQRRGGGRTPAQSWDEDFDTPSRMDRASRDGGAYRPRESGASGRGGRGGGGGGGRGYGGGFNRGPPRDYEGAEAGERQGGEDRGYGGGRGGRGGARGDRSGQGERRGYGRDALTSEQLSQRQALNQAIREASSWRDLASFVEEKGSVMDAENVASILFKLTGPRPGGRQGGRGGDQSYGSDFARPRDEAASAEYDRLLSTLLGWVLVLMPNFRPRQVTLTLQSLAKLELWNVEVVTALVAACIKQMGNLEPADYSNIMWSFAKFNYSPGQEFFDAYLTGSARKLGNMTPIDLAKLALSMSKLGCIPTAEWAEAFWKASSDNVADMSEMSTGDVLMATAYFAQAGQQPPQQWVDKVFGHYVETEAERSVRAAALQASYQQQLNELARQQMTAADDAKLEALPPKPTLSERQLPRIQLINKMLYTLSNLSCKPSPAWFAAVVDAWRRQMQYCSASDVGNIALYLGRYLSVPVSTSMCGTLLREVTRGSNAQRFRGDDLAAIAYLLSASRFKGSEKEIDDFVYSLKQRLHECNLSSLELVYNALPSLGSGYRLNETVTEAANRYNDMAAQAAAAEQANAAAAAVATA